MENESLNPAPNGGPTAEANADVDFDSSRSTPDGQIATPAAEASVKRSMGPHTQLGKRIASRNSIKHGISSEVVVIKGESPAKYKALLGGLRCVLQPVGQLGESTRMQQVCNQCNRSRDTRAEEI